MKIEGSARGKSAESKIKSFSRRKNGRGAFQDLISNHAGDAMHRSISKKRLNLLQNIKCNGWTYPLEIYVNNHRQAYEELLECSAKIQCDVPRTEQKVEFLIDIITCADSTLQAAICLVRDNTNNMREDFEAVFSSLIEVDPYLRSGRSANRNADVSSIAFKTRCGPSGVDL